MTNNFVYNLRLLLTNHNLSQEKLGKKIGVSQKRISTLINDSAKPTLQEAVDTAKAFDLNLNVLVFGYLGLPNERLNIWEEENKEFAEGEALYLKIKEARELVKKDSAGVVFLDHGIFDRHDELNALVRFLSKNHDKLKEDEIYRLYLGRVILEARNNEEREALKKMALQKQEKKS